MASTGPVDRLGIHVGTQVPDPTAFVPSADLAIKTPVLCATTAPITLAGLQTIDNVAVGEGDRVLVKDQTDQTQNGIYAASTGPWTRVFDADGNDDLTDSGLVFVRQGTIAASFLYQLSATNPIIIGTSAITFAKVSFPALGSINSVSPVLVNGGTSAPLNSNPIITLLGNGITFSLFQKIAASRLVGNPTGVLADASEIALGATLAFVGAALQTLAMTGDVASSANSFATTIQPNVVSYSKIQQVAASQLLGNPTGALANVSEISLGTTLAFSGSALQTLAMTGDISTPANSFVTTIGANKVLNTMLRQSAALSVIGRSANSTGNVADISTTSGSAAVLRESGGVLGFGTIATAGLANNSVTYAKLQQVGATSLVGNATAGLANATDISLGATLAFSGASLQTIAMSGDISTSANSFVTTIGANKVLDTMLRQSFGLSVIGRAANSTGNVADILAGAGNQVLRVNSSATAIAFGQLNLASSLAVTGTLASVNGGTDNAVYAVGDLLQASTTTTLARLAAVAFGNVLLSGGVGVVSSWGKVTLTNHVSGTLQVGNGGTGLTNLPAHGIVLGEGTAAFGVTAAMTDGQVLVGQTGADPLPKTMSGDATLAASGAITLGANVVTYAKFQQVAASSLVGNPTGALANAQGITLGATLTFVSTSLQTLAMTGDISTSANSFVTAIGANKVLDTMLRQSGALAVIGRSANSTGNVADIQATSLSDAVLRESGGTIGFGTIATAGYANNSVTYAKFQQVAASSLVGNPTGTLANAQGITLGSTLTFVSTALQTLAMSGDVSTSANSFVTAIGANKVLNTMLRQSAAFSVIGRAGATTGNVADISTTTGSDAVLRESGGALGFGTIATAGIGANVVTYAKIQQVALASLLGNPTGSSANVSEISLGATLAFSGTALRTIAMTGDVTTSANSFVTTIANSVVTNAKMANMADKTIKSNISGGSAAPVDNTLSDILDSVFTNTQGSLLYRGSLAWTVLTPGTSGFVLQTNGPAANPSWAAGGGGGGGSVTDPWVEHGFYGGI